ncbi:ADP-L-glycero-D-mannoheptose-6-epimerase [Cephaloticoccus primus]|uniref:ADP-L-glycero-D-manno-heptose-6-epimerase n=1 Tax=Cephaloticoccus primus TaxID=1548207 RepID=A0A139SQW8_9BACT|nr:ADP-L-glycero-D-mannoheptose-6-epimerase [Cephaloticoccus primus]
MLVTGGAGFIGSALVWALNRRGITNIVVSDVLGSDEKWRNLVPLRFKEYIEAPKLRELVNRRPSTISGLNTVFHLGACSSTTERDASYLADNNYAYTSELAQWAINYGYRFIYASSAATYGDGSRGMYDAEEDIDRLRPLNMYGYSKHLFDQEALAKGWLLERIVGLKYFNVFGPNEDHKGDMRSLVNKAYHQIQDTGRVSLFKSYHPDYKDGEQKRDFLYVKDAAEMTLHFATTGSRYVGLYNLGSGEANTWLTLTRAIFDALGREPQVDFIDMPEALRGKYQYFTQADIRKLRNSRYPRPVTPLADAVRDYVQNYLVPQKSLGY